MDNRSNMSNRGTDRTAYVKEVQHKLRDLQYYTTLQATLAVNGIYDEATKYAVTDFQRKNGLNPTGVVDYDTWKKINEVYDMYCKYWCKPVPLAVFPNEPMYMVDLGETSDLVMIIQVVMQELSLKYDFFSDVKPTGTYDRVTADAVKRYQLACNLPPSGSVDKPTWNMLATDYNFFPGYH
jgi:peptidoglycan hydrolase-like protein with peptidoglycan-binding domain